MSLKQKIVITCYLFFITGVALWGIWKQPIVKITEKITYPNAKYATGDIVWHFVYYRHYLYDGRYELSREWKCDTIKKITIYKDKTRNEIQYNDYFERELYDIDDSTIAICNMIKVKLDSLNKIKDNLKCSEDL